MAVPVPVRHRNGRQQEVQVWEPWADEAWSPLAELRDVTERFSALVRDLTLRWPEEGWRWWGPGAEVEERDDEYVVTVELPGVKKGDVDVELSGRRLTVRAERKEVERRGLLRRSTRRAERALAFETLLPSEVEADRADATLEDGVLTVHLPKPESARRARRKVPIR